MSCQKPDDTRGLRRMRTETDKEIVASNEARRRIKSWAMKEARVKLGIKEKYEKGEKRMRKCEKM